MVDDEQLLKGLIRSKELGALPQVTHVNLTGVRHCGAHAGVLKLLCACTAQACGALQSLVTAQVARSYATMHTGHAAVHAHSRRVMDSQYYLHEHYMLARLLVDTRREWRGCVPVAAAGV